MQRRKVILVRHGRSAHVVNGLLDLAALRAWRNEYELAGIDPADPPPAALSAAAARAGVIVASDAPRAIESARKIAPGRELVISPLLRELAIEPPELRGIRLPLAGWGLVFVTRWALLRITGRPRVTREEEERTREATEWLIELSSRHGEIVVVTHGSFRAMLANEFALRRWRCDSPRWNARHWSMWTMSAPDRD